VENLGKYYDHLVKFTAIGNILWPFGIFCGNLAYFSPFWYFGRRKIWQPWPKVENRPIGENFITLVESFFFAVPVKQGLVFRCRMMQADGSIYFHQMKHVPKRLFLSLSGLQLCGLHRLKLFNLGQNLHLKNIFGGRCLYFSSNQTNDAY
jgi:hypothetical protein